MSHPFPEEWLKACLKEYQVDKAREIYQSRWINVFWKEIKENIQEAAYEKKKILLPRSGNY